MSEEKAKVTHECCPCGVLWLEAVTKQHQELAALRLENQEQDKLLKQMAVKSDEYAAALADAKSGQVVLSMWADKVEAERDAAKSEALRLRSSVKAFLDCLDNHGDDQECFSASREGLEHALSPGPSQAWEEEQVAVEKVVEAARKQIGADLNGRPIDEILTPFELETFLALQALDAIREK